MLLDTLNKLKSLGFDPKNILDIGACKGHWSLGVRTIFTDAEYTLIDAIDYDETRLLSEKLPNINSMVLLLDQEEHDVTWYEMKNTGDSMFKENTGYFKDCEGTTKRTTTLDIVFKDQNLEKSFDMVKIDCQGAEIPILKGGLNTIKDTSVIILELPFNGEYNKGVPNFFEHIKFMNEIGYIPFDIVELHKFDNILLQIDILFIKKDHEINQKVQNTINSWGR